MHSVNEDAAVGGCSSSHFLCTHCVTRVVVYSLCYAGGCVLIVLRRWLCTHCVTQALVYSLCCVQVKAEGGSSRAGGLHSIPLVVA